MEFSIIIPVYNKSNTLPKSIDSALNQRLNDFEIVVVDDGSTDNFDGAIANYESNPKVRVVRQENAGVSVARNTGIMAAQGDYICFLDADDLYYDTHLETLHRLIEKYPQQEYFATSHDSVLPNGVKHCSNQNLKGFDEDFLCDNLFDLLNKRGDGIIHTNAMCIKKALLERDNVFFQPGERIGEDTDVWLRLALKNPIVISKVVTNVYLREFSTATANTSNSLTWIFARRNIETSELPAEKREAYFKLIDRYKMTCSRDYISKFDRKSALNVLKGVNYKTPKYYISMVLCRLPYRISKWLISRI